MNNSTFELLVYAISNLFRIYVLMRFSEAFFIKKDVDKWIIWTSYGIYFVLNTGCSIMFQNTYINLVTNIAPFFLITFFYQSRMLNRVIAVFSIYAVNLFWDGSLYAAAKMCGVDSLVFSSGIATSLMLFLTVLLLERFMSYKKNRKLQASQLITILTIPTGSIFIGMFTMQKHQFESYPQSIVIEAFILLFMNCMVFALYDILGKSYEQKTTQMVLEEQNRAYLYQMHILNQSQNQIKFLKHDMKNHFQQIRVMAKHGNSEKIIEYIDTAFEFINTDVAFSDSGNVEIDSILNLKLAEATAINAKIKTEISVPVKLNITAFELNIILGNLLDNAITALTYSEKKLLYLNISYENGVLYVLVKNSFNEALQPKKEFSDTFHGIGLQSVKAIVDLYHGEEKSEKAGGVYTANIMLFDTLSEP